MNEVEKLYENAEVNQICDTFVHWMQCDWETRQCKDCEHFVYPPFTAEKQLELIKWLSRRKLLNIKFSNDKSTYQLFNDKCTGSFCSDLATAIATLVQCELDFCTEEERKQVEKILK